MNTEKHHSINTVAEHLGVNHHCVRWWIKTGKLEHIRIGRRILVPESALNRLIEEGQKDNKTQ